MNLFLIKCGIDRVEVFRVKTVGHVSERFTEITNSNK